MILSNMSLKMQINKKKTRKSESHSKHEYKHDVVTNVTGITQERHYKLANYIINFNAPF